MTAICKRELLGYYGTLLGWLLGAGLLLFEGVFLWWVNFKGGYSELHYPFSYLVMVLLLAVPALTMRAFAGERRQKTDLLLYSLPLRSSDLVLGKFFAAMTVLLIPTAVMSLYPLLLSSYGRIPYLSYYSALLGFVFLMAALVALGIWISALCENPAAAMLLCGAALLLLYFMEPLGAYVSAAPGASLAALLVMGLLVGAAALFLTRSWSFAAVTAALLCLAAVVAYLLGPDRFQGLFPRVMAALSPFSRYTAFMTGVLDWGTLVYDLSFAGVCLFFAAGTVEKRRWS